MKRVILEKLPDVGPNRNGSDWVGGIRCPNPDHEDNHPSASMNRKAGIVYCHACGTIAFAKDYDITRIALAEEMVDDYIFGLLGINEPPPNKLPQTKYDLEWMLPGWWFERGFTKEMAERFGIYALNHSDICIPFYDHNGRYIGYTIRKGGLNGKRYIYGPNSMVRTNLFGLNSLEDSQRVILVEGILDAVWLQSFGYPAAALFRNLVNDFQIALLDDLNFKEVYVMLDNDQGGQVFGLPALKDRLENMGMNYYEIKIPSKYKDPQDIPESELPNIILYAQDYSIGG